MESSKPIHGTAADSPAAAAQHEIGHYRLIAKIGKGGMGEVWRATDTRLGRDVAVKLLPPAFTSDPIRLARFKREAQLLASLNHPGIAAIYGIEESARSPSTSLVPAMVPALVMELVEGPTLADRIKAGTIPLDDALPILRQIAEALEYAHERGIVHRDLKPANIKITPDGQAKVLDFGLAKAMGPDEASTDISNSPTLSVAMTEAGLLLGTAAYMSPEQAKAKPVDRRADIWAFGCVAYEMLTRQKTFDGETISDVLASVIRGEPEWNALSASTPAAIRRLLRRCLQKDPRQRLQAIGDARIIIEETISGANADAGAASPVASPARASLPRRALPWALGAVAVICAGIAAWPLLKPVPQPNVVRFALVPPANLRLIGGGEMSFSPGGRMLAFVAQAGSDKTTTLWLRPLDSITARPIAGTDDAFAPFWSPDGQQIGFDSQQTGFGGVGSKLVRNSVSGGVPQTLCDLNRFAGATWNRDGVILFSNDGSLYRVPDTGGEPTLVLAPDASRKQTGLHFPQFLPDEQHFIFEADNGTSDAGVLEAGSLDSKAVVSLGPADAQAYFAAPGFVFYTLQRTLFARPFSPRALRFTGPATPIAQNVSKQPYFHYSAFTVSPAGVLAYQAALDGGFNQITWFNRAGEKLNTVGQPDIHTAPAISPDGARFAVAIGEYGKRDIWTYDLKRGTASRLTFGPADNTNTAWSPDGTRILFSSNPGGHFDIFEKAANGLGSTQPFFQSPQEKHLDDLSADGRYAIYDTAAAGAGLWALPLFGDRKPFPFVKGNFLAASAVFAPNSRYVAYMSSETGRYEIYVQTFPQQTGKWQISSAGGLQPEWSRDGKELFYLASDGKLMAVDVNTSAPTFQPGIPKALFQTQLATGYAGRNYYVVSPDAQRFLLLAPQNDPQAAEPLTVVVNWPALLQHSGNR